VDRFSAVSSPHLLETPMTLNGKVAVVTDGDSGAGQREQAGLSRLNM
jgi:hypothetical protein